LEDKNMELNVIYTEVIDGVTYNEAEITDDDKSMLGEMRLALQIILTSIGTTDDNSGGITIHDSIGDTRIIDNRKTANLISQYTHRPLIDFDIVILDLDASSQGGELTFNFDRINLADDLRALMIRNPSQPKRIKVKINLNNITNDEGQVITPAMYTSLSLLRFENCVFPDGLEVNDRTKLILELYSCDVYGTLSVFENRAPDPISVLSAKFENCDFYDLRTFLLSRMMNVTMTNTRIINTEKDEGYYDEERPISDYIDPSLKIDNVTNLEITSLQYQNIASSIEIANCENVKISSLSGTHMVPIKPVTCPLVVHDSVNVTIAGVTINGIKIDSCEKAVVADIKIAKAACTNAPYGIMLSRITGEVAVTGLQPDEQTVTTGCAISMCEGQVTIADPIFQNIQIGVNINGSTGNTNIINGVFSNLTNTAILIKSAYGDNKIIDSSITGCPVCVNAVEGKNIEIVGGVIQGDIINGPNRNKKDVSITSFESMRMVDGSTLAGVYTKLDTVQNIELQGTVIEGSYFDIDTAVSIALREVSLNGDSSPIIDGLGAFLINVADSIEFRDTLFQACTPDISYVGKIKIQDCILLAGIKLHYSGDIDSEITANTFGDPNDINVYKTGIELEACTGIVITRNSFNGKASSVLMILNQSKQIIYDDSNTLLSNGMSIGVIDGEINSNHIVVVTDQTVNRPDITMSSCFKELLYFFAKSEYIKRYGNTPPEFASADDVIAQHKNVLSFINRDDSWVASFISKTNELIKAIPE
jgi:hypothetical protein